MLSGVDTREDLHDGRRKDGATLLHVTSQATQLLRNGRQGESGQLTLMGRDSSCAFSQDARNTETIHAEFTKRVR